MQVKELTNGPVGWFRENLFEFAGKGIAPQHLVGFVFVLFVTFWLSGVLQRLVERTFRARGVTKASTIGTSRRLIHYSVVLAGFSVALRVLGFDLTTLFATGAVLAVVVGFAMKNIAENFVSGVILLLERSINPGDVLMVDDEVVRVETMGIRATIARTRDEEELIIPNSTLVQTAVKNYTLADSLFRLRTTVGVAYESDMGKVRRVLEEACHQIAWRSKLREARVHLMGFGNSTVDWEVSVWIQDPWYAPRYRSQLNEAVWTALAESKITIAFPQLDLHLDPGARAALQGQGGLDLR